MNLENLIESVQEIQKQPPTAKEIEMYEEGYIVLKNEADKYIKIDHYDSLCGIKIVISDNIENVRKNECKIIFSDGSTKILSIFYQPRCLGCYKTFLCANENCKEKQAFNKVKNLDIKEDETKEFINYKNNKISKLLEELKSL